jgi:hypothetical protein
MASNLGGTELYKRDFRAAMFLAKYESQDNFELLSGRKVVFRVEQSIVEAIKRKQATTNLKLTTTDGKTHKFNELKKTSQFGGKGEGSGTAKEDKELKSLNDQLDAAKLHSISPTIPIKVGSKVYQVAQAVSTPGTPKSDFHLVDANGKEVVWISHKDGSTAKDFQQWGGVSQRGEPEINKHKETQAFIKEMKDMFPKGIPSATTVYRKITDTKLKMLSVYGNKYGGPLGRQNVSMLLQGPVKLVKQGSIYKLDSNHVHYNGQSVDGQGYDPVLMATYKGDRNNEGIIGARLSISPEKSRKGTELK